MHRELLVILLSSSALITYETVFFASYFRARLAVSKREQEREISMEHVAYGKTNKRFFGLLI